MKGATLEVLWISAAATLMLGCGANAEPTDPTQPAGAEQPSAPLDDITLHLNLGDSVGAGHNATDLNDAGGRAYARLLYENHPAYPNDEDHCVRAHHPDATFVDRAKSGGTSEDVVYQVFGLPDAGGGDVLVTIYVGGNDFNDDLNTMLRSDSTQEAIAAWETNMATTVDELRASYERPDEGRALVISMATIHEPTDQTLSIPIGFEEGFCSTMQQMRNLPDETKQTIYDNYRAFNIAIRTFAKEHDVVLIDSEELFVGHGLNAPPEKRWIDTDCTHLTDEGHHQLRMAAWSLLQRRLQ